MSMRSSLHIPVALLACALFACASQPVEPPPALEIAPQAVRTEHFPPSFATFQNGVIGIPGVTYATLTGYRPLKLDLYLPPLALEKPEQGFPLIVYVHGGDGEGGNSRQSGPFLNFPGVLSALSAKGYVVASVNYRLGSEAKFPAPEQDVKSAIRYLRSNARKFGIDPARAMTWGVSSGGQLAALTAVSCGENALEPEQRAHGAPPGASAGIAAPAVVSDCVQGAVSWSGIYDLTHESRLLGCESKKCTKEQLTAASPVSYVSPNDPPMLLIVGKKDRTVPYQQTLEMEQRLKAAKVPTQLLVIDDVDHALIGKDPDRTKAANLMALATTFEFFDRTMGLESPRK